MLLQLRAAYRCAALSPTLLLHSPSQVTTDVAALEHDGMHTAWHTGLMHMSMHHTTRITLKTSSWAAVFSHPKWLIPDRPQRADTGPWFARLLSLPCRQHTYTNRAVAEWTVAKQHVKHSAAVRKCAKPFCQAPRMKQAFACRALNISSHPCSKATNQHIIRQSCSHTYITSCHCHEVL